MYSDMQVLLIGAGRYGLYRVGRKYAQGVLGVKPFGVVDPKIDMIKSRANYCLQGIPTYHSLEEVPRRLLKNVVADVALLPQIVPQVFEKLANLGIKKVILPKPVATNYDDYCRICSVAEENNMQAVVASNWHYSDITKNLKALVKKITTEGFLSINDKKVNKRGSDTNFDINRIFIEYSKKDETLDIDPPLQELPHAMQILISSELLTKLRGIRTLLDRNFQSRSRVNLQISNVTGIRNGIVVNSDLKSGNKLQNNRERKVEIYLNKFGEEAKITADYDAVFDEYGVCEKYPEIICEYKKGNLMERDSLVIKEDNINKMYDEMFKTLRSEDRNGLTIDEYKMLAQYLSDIEQQWVSILKANK